jgi:hypothetical protein
LLISTIKLSVPIGIMLLSNVLIPLAANALPSNNSGSDGMFLPIPTSNYLSTYSNTIPMTTSHNSTNSSISSPSSLQLSPISNLNIHSGSDSYYYNNSGSWVNKTPNDSWKPLFAVAPFLNIPKNLIVPEACSLNVCPPIIGTQRGDIIIATAVNNARILALGGNDIIECGFGNCKVLTAFGNNVLMSGASSSAHLFAGSGGVFRPGNNIFIGGGGETLMVGGRGNDQFYAGSNNLFDGGGDIMIGGSGANYFDCGSNGNGVILDFNPAKGDTKSSNCKFVIPSYSANEFGPGLPRILNQTNASKDPLVSLASAQVNDTNPSNGPLVSAASSSHPILSNASNGPLVSAASSSHPILSNASNGPLVSAASSSHGVLSPTNEFGPGLPRIFGGPGSLQGQILNDFGRQGSLPAQTLRGFSANQANGANAQVLSPH